MSSLRFLAAFALLASFTPLACESGEGGDEGAAGQLGEACIGGSFCNDGLTCNAGICMAGTDEAGDSDSTSVGTGDTDTSSSSSSSSSDTGNPEHGLYEGPCNNSGECTGELFCADKGGRSWCTTDCMIDADCLAHPSASAVPQCESLDEIGGSQRMGCALECMDETECPIGAQCFYTGLASKNWCGFLP